jgi:hypothetical protein
LSEGERTLLYYIYAYLDRADNYIQKSAKVAKERRSGTHSSEGKRTLMSRDQRASLIYSKAWSVHTLCLGHRCGRTIRNLIIDISGMIRNVSGDLKSLVSVS